MFTPRLLKLKTHSRRVFIFKRCLPVFAFLLASVMIAWPALKEQKDSFTLNIPTKEATQNAHNDMEQVRFFSKDNNQNPFTVVAESVRETDSSRQIILMEHPKGTYHMANDTMLTGISQFGMVFQQEKYLYFEEKIDLTTNNGYQGVSSKVICEYESGTLGSDSDIFIKGPAGMLKANGFFMKDHGDYVHFKGNTHTLLFGTEKPIGEIDNLKFSAQKEYLAQDAKNIFITSANGLIINQKDHTVTAQQDVNAIQGDMKLTAPKVVLTYQKQKGETKILKLTAEQQATVSRPNEQAQAATMVLMKNPLEITAFLKKETVPAEMRNSSGGQMMLLFGKASLENKDGYLKAAHIYGLYDQTGEQLEKALAETDVIVSKEKSFAQTDRLALYQNPQDIRQILLQEELGDSETAGQLFVLTGHVRLKENDNLLKADKAFIAYNNEKSDVVLAKASGNAVLTHAKQTAKGAHIYLYKEAAKIKEVLKQLPADKELKTSVLPVQVAVLGGNATINDGENTITADKIYILYDKTGKQIEKSIAVGHLSAQNGNQKIIGEYGVYTPATEIVSVYKNVALYEKDSVLKGEYATLNLKTGISSLTAGKKQPSGGQGRVKGSLVPNDFKGK